NKSVGPTNNNSEQKNLETQQQSYKIEVQNIFGEPLKGAKVLLGTEFDENSFFETDVNGHLNLSNEQWDKKQSLTIGLESFVRVTYVNISPKDLKVQLQPILSERNYGISGITEGFGELKKDKWADVSVVAPLFSKEQLIRFDVSHLISDQVDIMKVFGQKIRVPSNISFPKQKEKYGWITLTLDKPTYRMPFYFAGTYDLIALHGRFPFEKTIDKIRNDENIFSVVNDFQINQGGITQVEINNANHEQNLAINTMQFDRELEILSPDINDEKEVNMIVGLNKKENKYFPSGIKYVKEKERVKINFSSEFENLALAFQSEEVKDGDSTSISNKISIQVMPLNSSAEFNLLARVDSPRWEQNSLVFERPREKSRVYDGGTYLSLTEMSNNQSIQMQLAQNQKIWEFYSDSWLDRLELPEWPTGLSQDKKLRWEVMFLGTNQNSPNTIGENMLREASHVSRNILDL
ncbi:MAG: hypothetical protein VX642_07865, partial [Bdellovibrionota bacterium]|nr:hypothetical protein [Bdellovibrionota bacterium]